MPTPEIRTRTTTPSQRTSATVSYGTFHEWWFRPHICPHPTEAFAVVEAIQRIEVTVVAAGGPTRAPLLEREIPTPVLSYWTASALEEISVQLVFYIVTI
jgi:hypothetical protein